MVLCATRFAPSSIPLPYPPSILGFDILKPICSSNHTPTLRRIPNPLPLSHPCESLLSLGSLLFKYYASYQHHVCISSFRSVCAVLEHISDISSSVVSCVTTTSTSRERERERVYTHARRKRSQTRAFVHFEEGRVSSLPEDNIEAE